MAKSIKSKSVKAEVEAATVLLLGESDPRELVIEGEEGEFFDGDTDRHTPERVAATAASLLRYGQLQRIRVVDAGARGLVVVMGRGRVLAARHIIEAGLAPAFAIKWEKIDLASSDAAFAMLSENTIRTAPNEMNAARILRAALDKGTPREEVETAAGGARALDAFLDILARATPAVQGALESGRITKSAAKRLAEQPADVQEKALDTVLDLAAQAEASEDGKVYREDIGRKAAAEVNPATGVGAVTNSAVEHAIRDTKGEPPPPKDATKGKSKSKSSGPKAPPAAPPAPVRDPKLVAADCLRRARGTVAGPTATPEERAALAFSSAVLDFVVNGTALPKAMRAKYGHLFRSLTGEGDTAQTDAA